MRGKIYDIGSFVEIANECVSNAITITHILFYPTSVLSVYRFLLLKRTRPVQCLRVHFTDQGSNTLHYSFGYFGDFIISQMS